jgi:iron complex outermembrane recepter protein
MRGALVLRLGGALCLLALSGARVPARADRGTPAPGAPAAASRAPAAERELTLDEIVVTGEPEDESANVHIVPRKEIEERRVHTAIEVLENETAVHATTGSRGERIFTFRGFDQRQVVVLVDGAPAYIPYDGQADLGYLPAEMIDHVSIVKGPASVLYGPNGLGGAINLVTRRPGTGPLVSAEAEVGREGSLLLGGLHSATFGRLGYTLFGGMKRRDAFPLSSDFEPVPRENGVRRDNSDSLLYHVGGNFQLRLPRTHALTASVLYIDGDRGVPPGLHDLTVRYWRFTTWRNVGASLGHSASYLDSRIELDELFYVRLYDNLIDGYDDATYTTQTSYRALHSWFHDQLFGGRARLRVRLPRTPWGPTHLHLWAGAQHDRHDEEPVSSLVTRTLVTVAPEVEAFFGERWSATTAMQVDVEVPGAAVDANLSSRVGWGPLFSGRFDPIPTLSLRATVARRTRFPTLKERFSTGMGTKAPNPDLGPEAAWHFGVEGSWQALRWLAAKLSVYDAEVSDYISTGKKDGLDQLQNIAGVRLVGTELALEARPLKWLTARAGYTYIHARRTEDVDGSDLLQYHPEHKATIELRVAPWRFVEVATTVRVVGSSSYQHPATLAWQTLDAWATWDLRLSVSPTEWCSVWVRASNLLDDNHETQYGYPDPGREIFVGMRLTYERPSLAVRRPSR